MFEARTKDKKGGVMSEAMAEMSSDVLRGYNDSIILAVLRQGDNYGYQISKRIRAASDERYVMKETTLYSAMNRLERGGLVSSYAGDQTQGRPRIYYHLTDEGSTYLRAKRAEWVLTKAVVGVFLDEDTTTMTETATASGVAVTAAAGRDEVDANAAYL
jgi:PadR family transcriptional regulator PadR